MGDLKGLAVLSCVLRALGVKQSLKPSGKFELHGTLALTCDDVLEHATALDSMKTQFTINSPTGEECERQGEPIQRQIWNNMLVSKDPTL